MYEVHGLDDLDDHAGQRVQIDGTFENVEDAREASREAAASGTADDAQEAAEDLVELRGTAIRQVAGSCATP
jgi:hypothetical protein